MKLGILAASTLFGVATLVSVSFADDGRVMMEMGRTPQADMSSGSASRFVAPTEAPLLQSDRPPAGMLPPPHSMSGRGYVGTPSNASAQGGNIQQALRPQ